MPILIFIALLAANGELPPASNTREYPEYVAEEHDQSQPVVAPVPVPDVCDARCERQERRAERQARREERRAARQARREARNNP